jgi:hypothetical protein
LSRKFQPEEEEEEEEEEVYREDGKLPTVPQKSEEE